VLFLWTNTQGISKPGSVFMVSGLAVGIAAASLLLAAASYFLAPEKYRKDSALAAYLLLLAGIAVLTLQTGSTDSPFLTLWMIAAIFSGIFGLPMVTFLVAGIAGYSIWLATKGQLTDDSILGVVLAGFLPLFISFILWHGKSSTEKTKERAYTDLANELNQVANKSEVVINAISDGVIAINNQGQIELINPAAQRIVGWDHKDALNLDYKSVLQLLSKDGHELDKSTDPVFEVLTNNQPKRRSDLQLQSNSGKKTSIEVIVSPIGRLGSGVIIVFRDVTKEQAEEEAQAEFISTASHEMRTPVASIEGYLGLALNTATATIDAKAREYITKAHESAEHLGRLFQDLLDVTKADDGRLSSNPKVIDIVSFTGDVVEGLQPKANEKNLRLFFKAGSGDKGTGLNIEPIYYVDLDGDHLREVLSNLVENAIKYTPAGEVVIDIQGDTDHVVVSIKDSGIGIPVEDIPHLFQKFYRVDNSDTREIGGTGLGLYLCRRLVEAMGGRIWVDSEYKKGSTFSVELPRISHEEANRLIEAGSHASIQPSVTSTYVGDEVSAKQDGPTDQQVSNALKTPIILSRTSSLKPASDMADPIPVTNDPLMGATLPPVAGQSEPLRPQNATVLPPKLQAMPSNLQTASPPMAPVATATPAPTPVAAPPQPPAQPPAAPTDRSLAVPKR
jgi:PAS domain S-box-containing protein